MKTVSIVIPIYKTSFNDDEWLSLDRCFEVVGEKRDIVIVAPRNLSVQPLVERYGEMFRTERFEERFFESIHGYNRLMMSTVFYERFLNRDYILIYQADCYIFEDRLDEWCNKGYDYIGAPWIKKCHYAKKWYQLFLTIKKIFCGKHSFERLKLEVGNGGLSLRKTASFHAVTIELKDEIAFYLSQNSSSIFNEDVFFALEAKRYLKIAPFKVALGFSFDDFPAVAFTLTKGRLPMGVHGWTKERCREFYNDKIS